MGHGGMMMMNDVIKEVAEDVKRAVREDREFLYTLKWMALGMAGWMILLCLIG